MRNYETPVCPHCNEEAKTVSGKVIYPHREDLYKLRFWLCESCDAYVGCHKKGAKTPLGTSDGNYPLGTPANSELRKLRSKVHCEFDPLWKNGHISRSWAYKQLAKLMQLPADKCHIAMFDVDNCQQALACIENIKQISKQQGQIFGMKMIKRPFYICLLGLAWEII